MPHDHADHDHPHSLLPSDPALRVKALETILVAKGLVDPAAMDAISAVSVPGAGPPIVGTRRRTRKRKPFPSHRR